MEDDGNEPHRQRVYSACQPCRTKKIKCNGEVPCIQCRKSGLSCQAGAQRKKRAVGLKDIYIRKLERRVAELERHIGSSEKSDLPERSDSTPAATDDGDDSTSVASALNDLKISTGKLYRHTDTSAYKYFGSSSAVSLIDEATARRSDAVYSGVIENFNLEDDDLETNLQMVQAQLPAQAIVDIYINNYFEAVHPLYPILDEKTFRVKCEEYRRTSSQLSSMPNSFLTVYLCCLAWGEYYSSSDSGGTNSVPLIAGWRFFLSAYNNIQNAIQSSNLEYMQAQILLVREIQCSSYFMVIG